jgi:hypothetical protein
MSNEQGSSVSWRERLSLWSMALQTLFGYDFFISYAWADGRPYAQELACRLARSRPSFRCFLDEKDMGGGEAWRRSVFKALRRSSILVVIGSPGALERDAVFEEISTFSRTGRPIVPIDFDAAVASIGVGNRLHKLIEERLRTDEPGGYSALSAGVVHDGVVEFLRRSFRFVRVHRVRMLVLGTVASLLGGLLLATLAGFLAAREGRLQAEARERDATLAAVRLSSSSGDYEGAARLLARAPTLDRRLIWAKWALQQHAAPAATTFAPFPDADAIGGISALSFHVASERLAGLVRRRETADSAACAAAFSRGSADLSRCRSEMHLVAFDALTGAAGPAIRVADSASQLAAQPASDEFLVSSDEALERYALRDGQWRRLEFQHPSPPGAVTLFDNEALGAVVEGGQLWQLAFDGPRWMRSSLGIADTGGATVRAGDGRSALWLPSRDGAHPPKWLRPVGGKLVVKSLATLPPRVRMLGQGWAGWLDDDARLRALDLDSGFEMKTRPLHVKPWLGAALVADGRLLVQEVADEGLETRTRLAVMELESGRDLSAGFITREPIWASAVDTRRSRVFLAGQGAWLTMADLRTGRINSLPAGRELQGPLTLVAPGAVEARYANDAIERRRVRFEVPRARLSLAQPRYQSVAHQRGDTGWLRNHDCPALADVSPEGKRIAFSGDSLVVAKLTQSERAQWRIGQLDLGSVCQRVLEDERRVEWRPENLDAPQNLRWVSESLLALHGFHGHAELLDVGARRIAQLSTTEAVTALSRRGPVLVSTLSGRVYQIGPEGGFEVFGQLPGLRALFPIDGGGEAFVAWMERPRRTAFVVHAEGRLQEVMIVADTDIPQDAMLSDGRLAVLYSRNLRLYDDLPPGTRDSAR